MTTLPVSSMDTVTLTVMGFERSSFIVPLTGGATVTSATGGEYALIFGNGAAPAGAGEDGLETGAGEDGLETGMSVGDRRLPITAGAVLGSDARAGGPSRAVGVVDCGRGGGVKGLVEGLGCDTCSGRTGRDSVTGATCVTLGAPVRGSNTKTDSL